MLLVTKWQCKRIKDEAEKAKKDLSNATMATISLPFIAQVNGSPVNYEGELSRAKFESLNKDLFDSTLDSVRKAMKDAKLSASDIDQVVLVGGSTRILIFKT